MQMAFSSIKESWDDAMFISLHGRQDDIVSLISPFKKVCILTDEINTPSFVAKILLEEGIEDFKAYVCEDMGGVNENILSGTLSEIRDISFSPLNIMILIRDKIHTPTPSFGLRESDFSHSGGLITKDEIRAVTISRLKPPREGVLWDIGAGSGSISIEVGMLSPMIRIFAIEKDPIQIGHINKNRRRFNTFNVKPIHGEAPDLLHTLPQPHRVFIGGTGGRLNEIIEVVSERLNGPGPVIVNATTIDTMNDAIRLFETKGFNTDLISLQVSRSKGIGGKKRLYPLNPIFIIMGEKGEQTR
jgi:precorrin-6Y C5,15-methyltransferase (decarboxylating)